MGLGKLLCIGQETPVGEPRFPAWTNAADLWLRCARNPDQHDRSKRESVVDFSLRNARRDSAGIYNGRGNGKDVPCQILGLQQAETESERIYLCKFIALLGRVLCASGESGAYTCRAGGSGYPPVYYGRCSPCAYRNYDGGSDSVVQRGYGSETGSCTA